jgi:hypothetical protein
MKRLLAVSAAIAMATPAYASLKLDGRYDYFSATSNSVSTSTNTSLSGFLFNRLELAGDEKVTDNVTAKARINLLAFQPTNASSGLQSATDSANGGAVGKLTSVNPAVTQAPLGGLPTTGVTDVVEFAQLTAKMASFFSLSAGKFENAGFGGFESMVTSADLYFASQGYMGSTFLTGAQADFTVADGHDVSLYLLNNNNSTDNTRMGYNIAYRGAVGDLGIAANYGVLPQGQSAQTTASSVAPTVTYNLKDVNSTYINVGLSYKLADWNFRLDYDGNTNGTLHTLGNSTAQYLATSGNNTTTNVITGAARWNLGNWSPWLQLESTSRQGFQGSGGSDKTDSIFNASLAVEYKVNTNDPFRYQAAYVTSSSTLNGWTNNSVNANYAFVGIRYLGDFLK